MSANYLGTRPFVNRLIAGFPEFQTTRQIIDLFTMNWEEVGQKIESTTWEGIDELVVLRPFISYEQCNQAYAQWINHVESCLPPQHKTIYMGTLPEDWTAYIDNAQRFGYFLVMEPHEKFRATTTRSLCNGLSQINIGEVSDVYLDFELDPKELKDIAGSVFEYIELPPTEYVETLIKFAEKDSVERLASFQSLFSGPVSNKFFCQNTVQEIDEWVGNLKGLMKRK